MLLCVLCGCEQTTETNISDNDIQSEVTQTANNLNNTDSETKSKPTETPTEKSAVEVVSDTNSLQKSMRVHFLDVGQADSIFIELGNGQTMLIDAGRSGDANTIINYIRNLQYSNIDFVVATHPHDDHVGGMADVLNSFQIGKMYMPKQAHTISAFEKTLDVIENKNIDLYTAKSGVNVLTDGATTIYIYSHHLPIVLQT